MKWRVRESDLSPPLRRECAQELLVLSLFLYLPPPGIASAHVTLNLSAISPSDLQATPQREPPAPPRGQ